MLLVIIILLILLRNLLRRFLNKMLSYFKRIFMLFLFFNIISNASVSRANIIYFSEIKYENPYKTRNSMTQPKNVLNDGKKTNSKIIPILKSTFKY